MSDQETGRDEAFMAAALDQARRARDLGEVPVGAVVVVEGALVATAHNAPVSQSDPTAHAEIVALRAAAQRLGNYRLPGSTLFVTLEPCSMCVGAMMHARVERLVFATREPKAGSVVSALPLLNAGHFNHRIEVSEGVLAAESRALLQSFFAQRRGKS